MLEEPGEGEGNSLIMFCSLAGSLYALSQLAHGIERHLGQKSTKILFVPRNLFIRRSIFLG